MTTSPAADRQYLLVANPAAQSGRAQGMIDGALVDMRLRRMQVELMYTEPTGTAARVRDRLNGGDVDVVVYLGGDGTFHEVAIGILEADERVPLGMLPAGTANDQGLSFGIRRGEIERNVDVIVAGHVTMLDVGSVARRDHRRVTIEESYFFDSCGWGIHPDILATRNRHQRVAGRIPLLKHLYRGKAIYVTASLAKLLESYVEPVKFACEVKADGVVRELRGMTDVVISATPIYAGHWVLDRHSEPDDGKFELVPFQGRRDWASKTLRDLAASPVWQEQLDRLGLRHAEGFSASEFELDFYRPEKGELCCQVDGEEWGTGDSYRIRAIPRALPLLTPADFVPPWKPR